MGNYDRSFIECVYIIRKIYPLADINIVLPKYGPIVDHLSKYASSIVYEPLWVLRRHDLRRLLTVELFRLPRAVARARARFRNNDLVYINTAVILDYLLAARAWPRRGLLHVHELPTGSVRTILRALLRWSRCDVIFNSNATRDSYLPIPGATTHVVYNGIVGPASPEVSTYDGSRPLRLLMLGRISRIKGQDVLVAALKALPPEVRTRIDVRIVGSAFGGVAPVEALRELVRSNGLSDIVTMFPFVEDPADFYRWADVVAVPSRLPESLGRVAIEAMAYGRPPLVSAIGGLCEVVEHERTGWLVAPDNVEALAERLSLIVTDPESWRGYAVAARARYESLFTVRLVSDAFASVVEQTIAAGRLMSKDEPKKRLRQGQT
ncbi:glycosyltransferase family 4 protein [Hyphomicrobiales bacterium BP6-180914]|uniref:Glycosyltransferase family 4 protein n=1 Tax=Lichenifustis flavocetrariae TaxID=2949735 RepID=A0AA41Z573_9HYPH|nr:glycosyltransferase family 4 protein [Lichenifustis flavocetrariae]MCW6513241.1 glycosyltransferase family 4 protein [Lichenifustis flavocetrariae]